MRAVRLSDYRDAAPAAAPSPDNTPSPATEAELRECIAACKLALTKVEQWTANLHANLGRAVELAERTTGFDFSPESGGTDKPPPDTP